MYLRSERSNPVILELSHLGFSLTLQSTNIHRWLVCSVLYTTTRRALCAVWQTVQWSYTSASFKLMRGKKNNTHFLHWRQLALSGLCCRADLGSGFSSLCKAGPGSGVGQQDVSFYTSSAVSNDVCSVNTVRTLSKQLTSLSGRPSCCLCFQLNTVQCTAGMRVLSEIFYL